MARKPRNKNALIAATILPMDVGAPREAKAREIKQTDYTQFLSLGAEIARDFVYYGNAQYKNSKKHFPVNPEMRTVDKLYPFAQGGPLYIDGPVDRSREDALKTKAIAMKEEGLRYGYITIDPHGIEVFHTLDGDL